jgi:hypothetical protein
MKNLLSIIMLSLSISANATKYYVATNGNNNNAGTIGQPWLTWEKGMTSAQPGDTVYFRGGVYPSTTLDGEGIWAEGGTEALGVYYLAYPGETPILDGSNVVNPSLGVNFGIRVQGVQNIHFKGLTIRNLRERFVDVITQGITAEDVGNASFTDMTFHDIGGIGIGVYDYYDTIWITNCDAYNVCDSLSWWPGQNGVAFQCNNYAHLYGSRVYSSVIIYEGCRAWQYSDNGFAGGGGGYIEYKNCWAFDGGMLYGEGCGFKLRASIRTDQETIIPIQRKLLHCIGAMNGHYGFSDNNRGYTRQNSQYLNCTAYHNGYKECGPDDIGPMGWGWMNYNFYGDVNGPNWITANSISYDNEQHSIDSENGENYYFVAEDQSVEWPESHNSWNSETAVVVNDADFISVDWTEMLRARKADNSLPDIDFMKLRPTSDMIDAGLDTLNIPFNGTAPDLGWFESGTFEASAPSVSITQISSITDSSATAHGTVSYDGGELVTSRGFCWSESINPTLSDTKVVVGGGTGAYTGSLSDLEPETTYYVRAFAINSVDTSFSSNIYFNTTATFIPPTHYGSRIILADGNFQKSGRDKILIYPPDEVEEEEVVLITSINIAGQGGATTISVDDGTLQMYADVSPNSATDTSIVWSKVDRTGTGTISTSGLLTASTDGIVTVRADAADASAVYDTIQITLSNQNPPPIGSQIIADHTIVDDYDIIPAAYMAEVKKMSIYFSGRSHSSAYRTGLTLLETAEPAYAVNVGIGEPYTDQYLRSNDNPSGYVYTDVWFSWYAYPVGDRPIDSAWVTGLIQSYSDNSRPYSVIGYSWCWDIVSGNPSPDWDEEYGFRWWGYAVGVPGGNDDLPMGLDAGDKVYTGNDVSMDTYLAAIEYYRDYCETNNIDTKVIYTTGPVQASDPPENAYQAQVKMDYIRDWVKEDPTRILFDWADILSYDNNGNQSTGTYDGNTYQYMTPTNVGTGTIGHISETGAIRLAKAQWWMLARIAGWDGQPE